MLNSFISSTEKYCTLEDYVAAPYFRQSFILKSDPKSVELIITALGFYEVHINGKNITKGLIAPYISVPVHNVYYDKYDITANTKQGKNVLAAVLGNGFQNPLGGYMWDFDKAAWRSAPALCFNIEIEYTNGEKETVSSSKNTKTTESPIIFDDLRHGEYYDASKEIEGWDSVDFDDSAWRYSLAVATPVGTQRLCSSEPIKERGRMKPCSVNKTDDGYYYDFGVNFAGLCEIKLKNTVKGQKVKLRYFETLVNGKPFYNNCRFPHDDRTNGYQIDYYYCKGADEETFMPHFTYHGFRYVYVEGITAEQATLDLLTYVVFSSDLKVNGEFSCDNDIVNALQQATLRSDLSNFYYFPTDCPQREKNGWTADASLSTEQMLYNFTPEVSYKEWLRNIYLALDADGKLPGIVPTPGWGYTWGNGPAWDSVMINLPYYCYIYRNDVGVLHEAAEPINTYLHYLETRLNDRSLLEIGLGDWCQPDLGEGSYETPLIVTDSIVALDLARKAAFMYGVIGKDEYKKFAEKLEKTLYSAIKEHLIDKETLYVYGKTQTSQAMALYHGLFTESEYKKAFDNLLELIKLKDNHCHCGVVGGSVFYELLSKNGYTDLAFDIITRTDFPSYGNWIARGATTLWESFRREGDVINSLNHHFWGYISAWFYKYLGGIKVNPNRNNINEIEVSPFFSAKLNKVNAMYNTCKGKLTSSWERTGDGLTLVVEVPLGIKACVKLTSGYAVEGKTEFTLAEGTNKLKVTKM